LLAGALMSCGRSICCCPNRSGPRHNLNIGRRLARRGHNRPMEPVRGETSPGRRRMHGASANRWAADAHALALLPTIRTLMAAGFVSQRELANELNRRGIPTALGGRWHLTTVVRMLTRLGLITLGNGRMNNRLAHTQAADERAKAMAPRVCALKAKGLVSARAIARELNERGMPTARGCKWHRTGVTRLLERLDRLDRDSRGQRRR